MGTVPPPLGSAVMLRERLRKSWGLLSTSTSSTLCGRFFSWRAILLLCAKGQLQRETAWVSRSSTLHHQCISKIDQRETRQLLTRSARALVKETFRSLMMEETYCPGAGAKSNTVIGAFGSLIDTILGKACTTIKCHSGQDDHKASQKGRTVALNRLQYVLAFTWTMWDCPVWECRTRQLPRMTKPILQGGRSFSWITYSSWLYSMRIGLIIMLETCSILLNICMNWISEEGPVYAVRLALLVCIWLRQIMMHNKGTFQFAWYFISKGAVQEGVHSYQKLALTF